MRPTDDQPTGAHPTDQTTDRRVTVAQAAVLLGLSEDAVRSRLKRGTLGKEKDADGTVFVVLGANGRPGRPTTNGDRPTTGQTTGHTTDQSALALMQAHLDSLGEQLTYVRDQLDQEREANRENRRIIAGLVQRVPELEAPRNGYETAAEDAGGVERPFTEEAQEAPERRSWWRRMFGE
jgi:predicted ArsR family transcriptional regulator